MYIDLSTNPSKCHYMNILNETMAIINESEEKENPLYVNILNQLADLKQQVVEKRIITEWDDINERYTLGLIAIQEFEDNDEMRDRLSDIFGGAVHYNELAD